MSSSPRTRPSTVALTAIAVGVLVIGAVLVAIAVGIDVIKYGETFVTGLYPPQAVTSQGAAIRDLYTIVFLVAVAIFFVVEGLILWSVIRYRRKPGDDSLPPQTHGNNVAEAVWTIVPTLIVAFLFVISWQTLNVVDAEVGDARDADQRAGRPVPVELRLHRRRREDRLHAARSRPARTAASMSPPVGPSGCS